MKRTLMLIPVIMLLTAASAAEELPVRTLKESLTRIPLAIVNKSPRDVCSLTITIDRTKLPEWLDVQGTVNSIDVPGGTRSSEKLSLILTVTDAPPDAEAHVPFTLTDDKGASWDFSIPVRVNAGVPVSNALYENFPNPFNPVTTIHYSLQENEYAKLVIYNSLGQAVRTLVNGPETAGVHTVQWNGVNENGQKGVERGVFLPADSRIVCENQTDDAGGMKILV